MPALVSPTSLGDTAIVCALAKAFKEKHGGPLKLIIPDTHKPIAEMYKHNIDEISCQPRSELLNWCYQYAARGFDLSRPIVAHPWWHGDGNWEWFIDKPNPLGLDDIYRYILKLDWNARFEIPKLVHEDGLGIEDGSVIILPNNNSNPEFPDEFWTRLIQQIPHKVYVNMAGNLYGKRTNALGAEAIDLTVENIIPTVNKAKAFISGNNGMACFLNIAQVKAKHIMLNYDKPFSLNGRQINYPISYQSFQYNSYSYRKPIEFNLNPDCITQAQIDAIAGAV